MQKDKAAHVAVTAAITVLVWAITGSLTGGILASIGAALVKEIADARGAGNPSIADLAADVAGIMLAAGAIIIVGGV